MERVGIFGATGFIGRHSCSAALKAGYEVHAVCRSPGQMHSFESGIICHLYDDVISSGSTAFPFSKLDCVFHLADNADRKILNEGLSLKITQQIAERLIIMGVKNLVYLSSVYATLDESGSTPNTYGSGKLAAENWLKKQHALKTIILRVPPVYGQGSKGGVQVLSSLISKRIPMPFKSAVERRDYLHISNLTDLFLKIVHLGEGDWKQLGSRSFEVSDGVPITTAKLVQEIASQIGTSPILFTVPRPILNLIGNVFRKSSQIDAAFNSLLVENDEELMGACGWAPKSFMPSTLSYLKEDFSALPLE